MTTALVIGAGPAGLMAAQTLTQAGVQVTVAEKMPSAGRKFLMAGKSGLNLTKAEDSALFLSAYHPATSTMQAAITDFGTDAVQSWARDLGQTLFTGSTGRVFPTTMKASPLLRAWLAHLSELNVQLLTRWTWTGWDGVAASFDTVDGPQQITADITILALGGASWSRLGSDGAWAAHIKRTTPFAPANVGFTRTWSPHMAKFIGAPVKGILLRAGTLTSRGEIVISSTGIEGGGIYEVSRPMRDGAALTIDLAPDLSADTIQKRWAQRKTKGTLSRFLKSGLHLSAAKIALLYEIMHGAIPTDPVQLSAAIKSLLVDHTGARPIDQAISTAGGVAFSGLTADLMLEQRPGVFCAGEMLDWEAPTGGYLITGCLATGRAAALGALRWQAAANPSVIESVTK